jgi:hypothetical protein
VRTRTWLTTPPGGQPTTEDRAQDTEHYVPAPDLPTEPRVPGRYRTRLTAALVVLGAVAIVVALVLLGQESQREDPSVPDTAEDDVPELPES